MPTMIAAKISACPHVPRPSGAAHVRHTPQSATAITATLMRLAPGTVTDPAHACRPVRPASRQTSVHPIFATSTGAALILARTVGTTVRAGAGASGVGGV